jgi:hypothetical protein
MKGDLAEQMVNGIIRYLQRATEDSRAARKPSIEPLRYILGVADVRSAQTEPELISTLHTPSLPAHSDSFDVYAVRSDPRNLGERPRSPIQRSAQDRRNGSVSIPRSLAQLDALGKVISESAVETI